MAVSKRLRFEIFRRDGHTCRYCGASAPDVKLTIDHVVPIALGGGDDPDNLVTACAECNAGKSSSVPDAPTIADVASKQAEYASVKQEVFEQQEAEKAIEGVNATWWRGTRPDDWERTIENFVMEGLTAKTIVRMAETAQNKRGDMGWRWAYFCGCCWNRIREAQQRAAEAVRDNEKRGT
jgi:hypothetical protein